MTHQITLEGSGHFPMIDETVQFNRLLTDFLALDQGLSPRELQMKEEWRRRVRWVIFIFVGGDEQSNDFLIDIQVY